MIAVAGHDARRNAAAHIVLAILVGVAVAVAVGALATARRTATAYDRLVEASGTADYRAAVLGDADGTDVTDLVDQVASAPGVRASWAATAAVARVDGYGVVYATVESGPADSRPIIHPVVVDGRDIAPGAADEVIVAQPIADELGLQPGDELSLSFLTREEMRQFDTGFGEPDGPTVRVRVVGISRTAGARTRTAFVAGPAFDGRYADTISVGTSLYVDIEPGAESQRRFRQAIDDIAAAHAGADAGPVEFAPVELAAADADRAAYAATARVLDVGQVVAAGIILSGTVAAVLQVLLRRHRAGRSDQLIEAALGLSTVERTAARTLAAVPAAAVAALVAAAGVVVAGALEPLGALADLEPSPGWAPHIGLTAAGGVAAGTLVVTGTTWAAWRAGVRSARPRRLHSRHRRWTVLRAVGSPAAAVGIGLAVDDAPGGRGATGAVPARASILLVGAGIAGLVAVLTFGASLDRLVASPDRWGFTADISVIDATDEIVAALVADPAVGELSLLSVNRLRVDGVLIDAYAVDPVGASGPGWTIVDGRLPRDADEVVLGRRLLSELGARIGSTVRLADGARLTVVGTGVGPVLNGEGLGTSMLVTAERLSGSGETTGFREALVAAADPAAAAELIARLAARYEVMVRRPPDEVANLAQLGRLPDVLALSLAAIAAAALLHSLVTLARRRATFEVLRALGFTSRDVAATLLAAGVTIVGLGLVIALPVGVAVGRLVWWAVADAVAVATDVAVPFGALAVVVVGALGIAVVAAAIPALGRRVPGPLSNGRDAAGPL